MRWPRRRPDPEPAGGPPVGDDAVTAYLRELADHWQRDPGVRVWRDLMDPDGRPAAGEALTGPTMLLPTLGPLATPAQQWRGHGGRHGQGGRS